MSQAALGAGRGLDRPEGKWPEIADCAKDICGTLRILDIQMRCVLHVARLIPGRVHSVEVHRAEFAGQGSVARTAVYQGISEPPLAGEVVADPFLEWAYRYHGPVHDGMLYPDSCWLEEVPIGRKFRDRGYRHAFLAPAFHRRGQLLGSVNILRGDDMPPFSEAEVAVARELGEWLGVGLANGFEHSRALGLSAHDYPEAEGRAVAAQAHQKGLRISHLAAGGSGSLGTLPHGATAGSRAGSAVAAAGRREAGDPGTGGQLTERERQVLSHLAGGLRDAEIAVTLVVSPNTVKHHVKSIYRKLGARSRTDAVRIALLRGLIPSGALSDRDHPPASDS